MSIQQMRKRYAMDGLDEKDVARDPMVQFEKWFEAANQPDLPDWFEINAMTLSTADESGRVSSRLVLLKGVERERFQFFTNYDSLKARQMSHNARVSLNFYWPHLERQVRVEGVVEKTDRSQSERYFHTRPRESQLGAHVSRQSSAVANRHELEQQLEQLQSHYAGQEVPCPENWGGYEVTPNQIEFWQGRPGRLHDRICYLRNDRSDDVTGWQIVRLSP